MTSITNYRASETKTELILTFFQKLTPGIIFEDVFYIYLSETKLQSKEYESFKYTNNKTDIHLLNNNTFLFKKNSFT